MKKVLLVALLGLGAVCLNGANLTSEQFKQLAVSCLGDENKISCQKFIYNGLLSVEQCDKTNCAGIGSAYRIVGDYEQTIKYYQRAGKLGDGIGYNNLGTLYERGLGVKQNFFEAFKFYKKACELNVRACYNLAVAYHNGTGTKQDFANAKRHYESACDASEGSACTNLGVLYAYGQGVKQDKSSAKKYHRKGCNLGDKVGCDNYRILNNQGVN